MKYQLFACCLLSISIVVQSQQNTSFEAHEWGTFTTLAGSNGQLLSGLYIDEEKLPPQTYSIAFQYKKSETVRDNPSYDPFSNKGTSSNPTITTSEYSRLSLKNVTVKMETPVIYFYSESAFEVNVHVDFPNGSISQWYPERINGERRPLEYLGYPAISKSIDFSIPYGGSIDWHATVLRPESTIPYSINPETAPDFWIAPRATQSNKIKVHNIHQQHFEKEKFLFYRGIGNFEPPVHINYSKRTVLEISNTYHEQIPYLMVYEKTTSGNSYVWHTGALNANEKTSVWLTDPMNSEEKIDELIDQLVNNGLYRDEAEAMIETWKKSYFDQPGMKVFWILPRSYTDEILPIQVSPPPKNLERVMIGRSEILTPEFEESLYQNLVANGDSAEFMNDRYSIAYFERAEQLKTTGLTFEDDLGSNRSLLLFPNPAQHELYFNLRTKSSSFRTLQIISETGVVVDERRLSGNSYYQESIDISNLSNGVYLVMITDDKGTLSSKFVKTTGSFLNQKP